MRATIFYTLLRLLVFLAAALVLALLGVHGLSLLALALVISMIVSIPLLARFRDRMSAAIANRVDRFHAGLDEGSRREDAD